MTHHLDLTDLDFERQFADHSIDASLFNHEAHLRLAWIHIDKYGVEVAIENICKQLQSFVGVLGMEDKYNETLTIAAIKAVHHFRLKSRATNFSDFLFENPRLKNNFRELISQHYKLDVLNSAIAKRTFLVPDQLPFD